jgi:ComF family protein
MPSPAAWRVRLEPFLEILFPTRCAGCGSAHVVWCDGCRSRLRPVSSTVCLACRRVFLAGAAGDRCGPAAPHAWAVAVYRPPLDRAIKHLKYRPDARLAQALAGSMADVYHRHRLSATCLVPVPLSRRRQRQRGYNQAELLGRALAGLLGLPSLPSAAVRIRETGSQVGLEAGDRWANVDGAFAADPSLVRDETVLLIDDVHTTGATLAACSQALAQAGARRVVGLTVARA